MKLLLLTICSLVLFACQSEGATEEFIAKIISLNENSAVVLAEDLSGYPGGAEISVSLSEGEDWEIGDVVRVEYKGGFMESHPMQIDQKSLEKIE